jgi:hypothetical protein
LLTLLRWEGSRRDCDFFIFSLVFGLSLGAHISNLGFAPAFALFVLLTDWTVIKRPTWWLAGLVGFGLGIAQFAWLPLRADTLNDRIMLERAPTTLKGIYDYTLGSFPQFKFAFPISALPDRVALYLYLLTQQFGWLSLLIGVLGLIALLLRRPRVYFLLMGMYLIQVWFFIQYRAFDLDVFFLPAHLLWAIFLAFGLVEILAWIEILIRRISKDRSSRSIGWALTIPTLALALIPLHANLSSSDHSFDVAINDFYANVWEILPTNAALLTQSGVFGYDTFYWRLVYDTRSDVLLPALPSPSPSPKDLEGCELFSTTPLDGQARARGPGALPPNLLQDDLWQIPVLVGVQTASEGFASRGRLTLYHLSQTPPDLIVAEATPEFLLDINFGGLTLLGLDLDSQTVESGGRIHLILYWQIDQPGPYQIETSLGNQSLEMHRLGFGNFERYLSQFRSNRDRIVVEDYWLVIPSTTPAGSQNLSVRLVGQTDTSTLTELTVLDGEETMERWLRIAGKSSSAP